MALPTLLEPDFLLDEDGDVSEGAVLLDGAQIAAVGKAAAAHAKARAAVRVPLPGRMLMPAFVNAHSHAFQRGLRGRVERRTPGHEDDDFWSWREQMYALALRLDAADFEAVATWAYLEMLRSGFGAVGEFHYVHHDVDGRAYAPSTVLSSAIARAAEAVGIRVALLQTAYARAGADAPPTPMQRRFVFDDVDAFLAHCDTARETVRAPGVSHGVAIHSVRACPRDWIEAVASWADERGAPLHVHACEQRAELESCRAEHGLGPLALLDAAGALGPRASVVHATHIDDDDVRTLKQTQSTVVVCPSTERNLGDGLCPIADLHRAGVSLAVGSDSHARIDVVDELRSLEDHERLRLERRAVLAAPSGHLRELWMRAGTRDGAKALGLESGRLATGAPADLVAVTVPLEGRVGSPEDAFEAWMIGGSGRDVSDVFVGGEHVLAAGRPTRVDTAAVETRAAEALRRALA